MLNAITDAGVEAEDRLFVTLIPARVSANCPRETVLFTDTVGFISNLPHDLVDAFMSTLKSVQLATSWCTSSTARTTTPRKQIAAVREVLREIDADRVPENYWCSTRPTCRDHARDLAKLHEAASGSRP